MIIVDLNQVMIANLMVSIGTHTNTEIKEELLRHMVLNSIRHNNVKFRADYGEMVIACDDKNYWRRDKFPYYKAARKANREKSELDWNAIFTALNKIRDELRDFFPYRVIRVSHAEADDIIASLCHEYHDKEQILILSGDKDFIQLQAYPNVSQYNPVLKKKVTHKDPKRYRIEHTLRGDAGDGVPNFLSADDIIITPGARQKPVTKKKIEPIIDQLMFNALPKDVMTENELRGYHRNKEMIDLFESIPTEIREQIISQYEEQKGKGRDQIFNYFFKHKLKQLNEHIRDF